MALLAALALVVSSEAQAAPEVFEAGGLAPDPRGGIVVYGSSFAVAKLRPDGSLDAGFGREGIAKASFPRFGGARSFDAFVRADGKVVVAGYVAERCAPPRGGECPRRVALARFSASGKLDRGFGGDGVLVTRWRGHGLTLAAAPPGSVTVAGRTAAGLPFVARYRADGSPDRAFGSGGRTIVRELPGIGVLGFGRAAGAVATSAGKATIAVYVGARNVRAHGLLRFTARGRLDRSFGEGGFVDALAPGAAFDDYGYGLVRLPDGRLLVAAVTSGNPQHIALVMLRPDGSVDGGYGSGGVALGPTGFDVRFNVDLALLPDGGAIVGAAGFLGAAVARFDPRGQLDRTFAMEGMTTPIESWGSRATVSLLADGGVALADTSRDLDGLLVGRFGADGTPAWTVALRR